MTEFHKLLVDVYLSDLKHDFKASELNLNTINNINIPESILKDYLKNNKLNTSKILSEDDLLFKYIDIICNDDLLCKSEVKNTFSNTKFNILDYLLYIIQQQKENIIVNVGFNKYKVTTYDLDMQIPTNFDNKPFVLLPDMTKINLLSIIKLYSSIKYIGSTTPMVFDSNNIIGHTFNIKKSKLFKNSIKFQSIKTHDVIPITTYSQFNILGLTASNYINTNDYSVNTNNKTKHNSKTNNNSRELNDDILLTKLLLTNYNININPNEKEQEITITLKNVKLDNEKHFDITVPGILSNSNFMNRFNKSNAIIKVTDTLTLNYEILKLINMLCKRLSDSCQSLYCASNKFYNNLKYNKQKLEPLFYTEDRIALLEALIFGSKHILTHNKTKFILFTLNEQDITQKTEIQTYFNNLSLTPNNNTHFIKNSKINIHNQNNDYSNSNTNSIYSSSIDGGGKNNISTPKTDKYSININSKAQKAKEATPFVVPRKRITKSRSLKFLTPIKQTLKRKHNNSNNSNINSELKVLINILQQLSTTGNYKNINIRNILSCSFNTRTNNIEIKDIFFKPINKYYKLLDINTKINLDLELELDLYILDPEEYIKNTYNIYKCKLITEKIKSIAKALLVLLKKTKYKLTKTNK